MHDAVLAREGDVVPNAGLDEDLTVLMKSLKRDLQVRKTLRVDSVAPGNVTEFQKRRKSLNNVGWNDPYDGREVDLECAPGQWIILSTARNSMRTFMRAFESSPVH
jgi:hypothetical protein